MSVSRNLLARTRDYVLWTEDHLSKSVIYDHGALEIRVPAFRFKFAIRRPNGELVFRCVEARQANDLLYELSARLRPLGASAPTSITDDALPKAGDGRAETTERAAPNRLVVSTLGGSA